LFISGIFVNLFSSLSIGIWEWMVVVVYNIPLLKKLIVWLVSLGIIWFYCFQTGFWWIHEFGSWRCWGSEHQEEEQEDIRYVTVSQILFYFVFATNAFSKGFYFLLREDPSERRQHNFNDEHVSGNKLLVYISHD